MEGEGELGGSFLFQGQARNDVGVVRLVGVELQSSEALMNF